MIDISQARFQTTGPGTCSIRVGNFDLVQEFGCKCGCGQLDILCDAWRMCQITRCRYRAPVVVTSGSRCPPHNTAIGGAPDSSHLLRRGSAVDFFVIGIESPELAIFLMTLPFVKRVGIYLPGPKNGKYGFCHGDVRARGPGSWATWTFDGDGGFVNSFPLPVFDASSQTPSPISLSPDSHLAVFQQRQIDRQTLALCH